MVYALIVFLRLPICSGVSRYFILGEMRGTNCYLEANWQGITFHSGILWQRWWYFYFWRLSPTFHCRFESQQNSAASVARFVTSFGIIMQSSGTLRRRSHGTNQCTIDPVERWYRPDHRHSATIVLRRRCILCSGQLRLKSDAGDRKTSRRHSRPANGVMHSGTIFTNCVSGRRLYLTFTLTHATSTPHERPFCRGMKGRRHYINVHKATSLHIRVVLPTAIVNKRGNSWPRPGTFWKESSAKYPGIRGKITWRFTIDREVRICMIR